MPHGLGPSHSSGGYRERLGLLFVIEIEAKALAQALRGDLWYNIKLVSSLAGFRSRFSDRRA